MTPSQLEDLILQHIDGSISAEDHHLLEQELLSNPDSMATYLAYTDLENLLQVQAEVTLNTNQKIIPVDLIRKRQNHRTLRIAALSSAAIILITLFAMRMFSVQETGPQLTFKTSPGTVFTLSHITDNAPSGSILTTGSRLKLTQGTAELTFSSGVESIITAPADLTLTNQDTLLLKQGTAWFHVPHSAIGFTVNTTNLKIVDLGTEFGVLSRPDSHDEIHVFDGKVHVTTTHHQKETATLTINQARRSDPVGRLTTITSDKNKFITTLPKSLPYIHWTFDNAHNFQSSGTLPKANSVTSSPVSCLAEKGTHGKAASFNGTNSHIRTNWSGITGRHPRSIACWIKLNPNNPRGWASIAEWGHPHNQSYWRFRIVQSNGKAVLRLSLGDEWYDGSINIADGKWHHIACIDSGSNLQADAPPVRFFIDGNEDSASPQNNPDYIHNRNTRTGLPLIIGTTNNIEKSQSSAHLQGLLDELYIFHGALTPDSVRTLMQTNNPDIQPNQEITDQ